MENEKYDFSRFGLPPQGVSDSILKNCCVVEIGLSARVPLVVPFGSLESVVKMALSAGMCVVIDVKYNSDLCIWKNEIQGVLKDSDV